MTEQIASLLSGVGAPIPSKVSPAAPFVFTGTALQLEKVHNLRDLGGLHNLDGRRLCSGRLFRGANPAMASAADRAQLQALGLDLVVDFRSSEEKSVEEQGFADGFNWLALPVLEGSLGMNELVPRLRNSTRQEMAEFMLQVYRDFPTRHRSAFGAFMREAQAGRTLLYHCSTGKDRTGFATLLLLSALEVSPELIMANYLESNHWNQHLIQGLLARLSALGVSPEVAMPLLEVRAGYLEASLQTIEREWGSMARYLSEGLSVDSHRLQALYLEKVVG